MAELAFAARLFLASFIVLFLPGWLSLRFFVRKRTDLFEAIALAFALSLAWLVPLTAISIEAHGNSAQAAGLLLALIAALAIFSRRSKGAEVSLGLSGPFAVRALRAANFAGLAIVLAFLYWVGGTIAGAGQAPGVGEEALHVVMIRKLLENPFLSRMNLMYKEGVPATYVYPVYHFALALVSRLSGLDPMAVFIRFRPIACLAALSASFGILQALFRRRLLSEFTLMLLILLVLTNMGGQIREYFWAQFAPLSHPGDFGLGVLLPLLALAGLRFVRETGRSVRAYLLFLAIVAAGLLIHTREVLQIFFCFLAAFGGMLLLSPRRFHWSGRFGAALLGMAGLGLVYRFWHAHAVSYVIELEHLHRQAVLAEFDAVLKFPFWRAIGQQARQYYDLMGLPYFIFGAGLVPFLFLFRRKFGALFLGCVLLAGLCLMRIPQLSRAFVAATYSEMMMTPARYLFPWCYYAAALALAWILARARRWVLTAGILVGLGLLAIGPKLVSSAGRHPDRLYAWAIAGSLAAVLFSFVFGARKSPFMKAPAPSPRFLWGFGGLAAVLLFQSSPPALWSQGQAAFKAPSVARWEEWYRSSELARHLPAELVGYVRREVPALKLFAVDYGDVFALPVAANQYALAFPAQIQIFFPTEFDFMNVYEQVKGSGRPAWDARAYNIPKARDRFRAIIDGGEAPIFNAADPPELVIRFIDAYGLDYVLVNPRFYERLSNVLDGRPEKFRKVYDRDRYALYAVAKGS